jgi:hypothetical protein
MQLPVNSAGTCSGLLGTVTSVHLPPARQDALLMLVVVT